MVMYKWYLLLYRDKVFWLIDNDDDNDDDVLEVFEDCIVLIVFLVDDVKELMLNMKIWT